MAIYAGLAAWVLYALSFLVVSSRTNVPRAVVSLLAGICLLDALLISASGGQTLAWLAVRRVPADPVPAALGVRHLVEDVPQHEVLDLGRLDRL